MRELKKKAPRRPKCGPLVLDQRLARLVAYRKASKVINNWQRPDAVEAATSDCTFTFVDMSCNTQHPHHASAYCVLRMLHLVGAGCQNRRVSRLRKSPRRCFSTTPHGQVGDPFLIQIGIYSPDIRIPLRNFHSHQRYPSFSVPPVVQSGYWTVSAGFSEGLPFPCPHVSTTRSHRQPRKRNARCFV